MWAADGGETPYLPQSQSFTGPNPLKTPVCCMVDGISKSIQWELIQPLLMRLLLSIQYPS